jgi:ParB family chromosome partitioning protein
MSQNLKDRLALKSADLIGGVSNASKDLSEEPKQWEKIHTLDCTRISPNPFQYRIDFNEEKIVELMEDFQKDGQLQPIGVRRFNDGYQIIFGEHRWRAGSRLNGKVLAIIRDVTDEQMASMCFGENKRRSNPSAYEDYRAISIQKAMGKTPKEIQTALSLRPQDYYKLSSFEDLPKPVIDFIEKHLNVIGKTEAEALKKILDDEHYDKDKFTDVVLEAMDRFVANSIETRKKMIQFISSKLRIKNQSTKPKADKAGEASPQSELVHYDGKPVGSYSHSDTTVTLSLNKEELPQDKIKEFTDFIDKFLKS